MFFTLGTPAQCKEYTVDLNKYLRKKEKEGERDRSFLKILFTSHLVSMVYIKQNNNKNNTEGMSMGFLIPSGEVVLLRADELIKASGPTASHGMSSSIHW